jgi:hypothetical protein
MDAEALKSAARAAIVVPGVAGRTRRPALSALAGVTVVWLALRISTCPGRTSVRLARYAAVFADLV